MNKIFTNIVIVVVTFMALKFAFTLWAGQRFMQHSNECHAELHIGEKIHQPMGPDARNALFNEFQKCIEGRSNFVELLFVRGAIEAYIDDLKKDPHSAKAN